MAVHTVVASVDGHTVVAWVDGHTVAALASQATSMEFPWVQEHSTAFLPSPLQLVPFFSRLPAITRLCFPHIPSSRV